MINIRILCSIFCLVSVQMAFSKSLLADKQNYSLDKAYSISKEFGQAKSPGSSKTSFFMLINFGGASVDIWSVFTDKICFDNVPQRQSGKFKFVCNNGDEILGSFSFVGDGIIRSKLSIEGNKPETYMINLNKRFNKDEITDFYKGTLIEDKNSNASEDSKIAALQSQLEQERLEKERAKQEAAALALKKAEEEKQKELAALQAQLDQERLEKERAKQEAAALALKKAEEEKQKELAALQAQLDQERLEKEKAKQDVAALATETKNSAAILHETTNDKQSSNLFITNEGISKTTNKQVEVVNSPEQAQIFINEIQSSIAMYMAIAKVIDQQPPSMKKRVLKTVENEINRLRKEKETLQQLLTKRFSTPIKPTNANLQVSAFRASDTFPKIPFYVPGTNEIGEMLAVPRITDEGFLEYQFDFLDPLSSFEKVRERISIRNDDIDLFIDALIKIDEWTIVAQENGLTRRFEKTAGCIPSGACDSKKQGVSSTEVVFQVYEDGSTAGRIQRNKGLFSVGYNMSVESSILLSAYLTYMREAGSKEFNIGVMSDKQVDALFE